MSKSNKNQGHIRRILAALCALALVFSYTPISISVAYADDPQPVAGQTEPCTGEHEWDEGEITKEPTFDSPGERTFKCRKCGATKTEEIEKYALEAIVVDGIWQIDDQWRFVKKVTDASAEQGEPITVTIAEPGGKLRIRLKEIFRAGDGSQKSVLEGEDAGWQELDANSLRFTSEQPSVVSVDEKQGVLEAKSNSSEAGVSISVYATSGGVKCDSYVAHVVTTNQPADEPAPNPRDDPGPGDGPTPGDNPGSGGDSGDPGAEPSGGDDSGSGGSGSGGSGSSSGSGGSGSGGDSSSSGGTTDDSTSPVEIPDIPTEVTNKLVRSIGVQGLYSTTAHGDWLVNDPHGPLITQQGGKLRIMLYQVEQNTYKTNNEPDAGWITINQRFYSSNPSVISVNNSGTLTARKNGTVTIHVFGDGGLYTSIDVRAENQDNSDVASIHILDENGEDVTGASLEMGNDSSESSYRQYYARVEFIDGSTSSTLPGAADYDQNRADPRLTDGRLTWLVNNEDVGYVNASTGRFKALDDGQVKIQAQYGDATGYVWMTIGTGKYSDAHMPSDTLTVKVCYEMNEGLVYFSQEYSIDEFSSWGLITESYTLTRSDGKYVSDVARGVPLTTICENVGVKLDEVTGFRFQANDGANPGFLSRSMLFDTTRYCFPNYDLGGSFQEAYEVPAMLALADNWTPNTTANPDDALNEGTRFRLVFGSTGRSDNLTSKSLKYINTLIIVLEGAAPAGSGTDGQQQSDSGDGVSGTAAAQGDGDSNNDGNRDSNNGSGSSDENRTASYAASAGGTSASPLSSTPIEKITFEEENDIQSDEGGSAGGGRESSPFQVFEMMAKRESKVDPLTVDNILMPYALPATLLVLALGGGLTFVAFRREITRPIEKPTIQ